MSNAGCFFRVLSVLCVLDVLASLHTAFSFLTRTVCVIDQYNLKLLLHQDIIILFLNTAGLNLLIKYKIILRPA